MNSSRSLLSSPLFASSSPNFRSSASVSSSPSPSRTTVPMIHDTSSSRASTACHYSPSLVAEEQLHGSKDTLTLKGEKALLELLLGMALDQHVDGRKLITQQEAEDSDFESYLREATSRVLYQPTFIEEDDDDDSVSESSSASLAKPAGTLDLGKLTEEPQLDVPQPHRRSVDPNHSYDQVFIRSTRLLERRSKKRNGGHRALDNGVACSGVNSKRKDKFGRVLDPDEPFRLFLRDRETTEFLTAKEEKQMFSQIQNLMKLEGAQRNLQAQCGREPTVEEWAQAVGMSCRELQSCVRTGRRCREKMARSNFRLVIHVARKYEGCGLDIQDLVQEITEDPNIEGPEVSVDRLMMRQQVRSFLTGILSPREKEIIEHRFGIHDGQPKTLHVIGDMYGLSKERIRQVQNKALDKLRNSISAQGFHVYFDLLT
ncbi:sigma-like factor6 [Zea mays]|uniref:Sigma-like factor6 n=1 Tax=Zea mays TaxID=4577 RepID=A0A1D6GCS3_MAIZE|nr:sigma-like factor6 [Zea mays]